LKAIRVRRVWRHFEVEAMVALTTATYHVLAENDHWIIRQEGSPRVLATHDEQRPAVAEARRLARSTQAGLVIHDGNGGRKVEDYTLDGRGKAG
jgi:hypothetical protein